MAAKISTDVTVYFVNFNTGNDAGDIDSYSAYPSDFDTNFTTIRDRHNELVDEVLAIGGSGALLNFDMVFVDDASSPGGVQTVGLIGEHSYKTAIAGDTTKLDVAAGTAIITGNQRVTLAGAVQLTGSGGSATRWVALDVNGAVTLQTSAGVKQLDLFSVNWNGSAFDGSVTRLASILFDGDAYRLLRERVVVTGSFTAKEYDRATDRINAIERILGGVTADIDTEAIGPLQLNAEWITTGDLALERGGLNFDATTGLANSAFLVGTSGSAVAWETGATARTSIGLGTADAPQFARIGLGTAAGAGSELAKLARAGDVDLLLTDSTPNAALAIRAGAVARIATTTAHDIEMYRGGVAAANLRIDINANGVALYDSVGSKVMEVGAADTLGFYSKAPLAQPDVAGVIIGGSLAQLQTVMTNLINALDATTGLGLLTDSTT